MKRYFRRCTALLLLLLLLLSAFSACADTGTAGTTDTPTEAPTDPLPSTPAGTEEAPSESSERESQTTEEPLPTYSDTESENPSAETNPTVDPPAPPPDGSEGYTYRALVCTWLGGSGGSSPDAYVFVEKSDLDYPQYYPLAYAAYQRNLEVESTYNCRIEQVETDEYGSYHSMRDAYLNGTAYELAVLPTQKAVQCAAAGLFRDVYTLKNIDPSHPTYNRALMEEFTHSGKLYFIDGAMNVTVTNCTQSVIFNRTLQKSHDFGELLGKPEYNDLYALVKDGKWTVDAMLAMASAVNNDVDKSGGLLDVKTGDTVGFFQSKSSARYYFYGCGARITEKNEDGTHRLAYDSSHAEKAYNFLYERLNVTVNESMSAVSSSMGFYYFENILFTNADLWCINSIYKYGATPYGILPIPKMSETQNRYYNYSPASGLDGLLWSVPVRCENADNASLLLHAMAVYSYQPDSLLESYYTHLLHTDEVGNAAARSVLRTVRESAVYDAPLTYSSAWCNFIYPTLQGISTDDQNNYASAVTEEALKEETEQMNAVLYGIENPTPPLLDENGIAYQLLANGTYEVVGCINKKISEIVIPATFQGRAVTRIGYLAFCQKAPRATSLTIPEGVTSIGDLAFEGCVSLVSVTLPEGLTSIGAQAFRGCERLSDVTLPDSLTSIGRYAFSECKSLVSIMIPEGVAKIDDGAFAECTSLSSVTIPNSVTYIGNYAFGKCSALTSAVFGPTEGWSFYYKAGGTTSFPPKDFPAKLADPAQAALQLRGTYCEYVWQIKTEES